MDNEIVLKYFMHNGELYELVYKINSSNDSLLPQNAKKELDKEIKTLSAKIFEDHGHEIQNLPTSELLTASTTKPLTIQTLEDAINQEVRDVKAKVARAFYSHKTPALSLTPSPAGAASVHVTSFSNISLEELLKAWMQLHLNPDDVAELESKTTPSAKMAFFESKIRDHAATLSEADKKTLLDQISQQFSQFLEGPHVLIDLDISEFSQLLEFIGLLMNPRPFSPVDILEYLKPILSKNTHLIEHLKPFKDPEFSKHVLLDPLNQKLQSQHESYLDEASLALEGIVDPSRRTHLEKTDLFYRTIGYEPSLLVETKADFYRALEKYLTKSHITPSSSRWTFDSKVDTYPLSSDPDRWRNVNDTELTKLGLIDAVYTSDAATQEAKLTELKTHFDLLFKEGFPLSVSVVEDGEVVSREFKTAKDFYRIIEDMPITIRIQILSFLSQDSVLSDFQNTLPDGKNFKAIPLKYNFFLKKVAETKYTIGFDADTLIYQESSHKSAFKEVKSTKMVIGYDSGAMTKPQGLVQTSTVPLGHFNPECVMLALDNLTGRTIKPGHFHII